jgi:FSR family fosmidomycin resistance protein-like MFS transporter
LSHELLPRNLSLASSLVVGFSSGFAGIANMFMGKLADNIGIQNTIYILLIFPFLAFILMFFLPKLEQKLK